VEKRIAFFVTLILVFTCFACSPTPTSTPYPSEVDWETAVAIIHSGQVEMIAQLHSLDVALTMKDGSSIHTIEPFIDAVFQEVDKCGKPCSTIILATE
jgi:hypothetical protein